MPLRSLGKNRAMDVLKKRGNFRHNLEVIKNGAGVLAVCTPLIDGASPDWQEYDFCRTCQGWFSKNGLDRHHRKDR